MSSLPDAASQPWHHERAVCAVTILLLGWYAVQTGITGALISGAYGLNYVLMTVIAGLLYIAITFVGVRGLHWIGLMSVPLFVCLGLFVAGHAASTTTWAAISAYPGNNGTATMSMGVGLTVVIALFADAGTVTPDFNRWARNGRDSWIASFGAFPCANIVAMLIGGVMTAALAVPNANPFGNDNMFGYLNHFNIGWVSLLAAAFLYINLGSVCSHCLYQSATSGSRVSGTHMRVVAVVLGVVGIVIAAGNVWIFFIQWLSLLGVIVPPIGVIVLVDQYVTRPGSVASDDWRPIAFLAWGIGSIVAFAVEKMAPGLCTAISSAVVAGAAYWILSMVTSRHATALVR